MLVLSLAKLLWDGIALPSRVVEQNHVYTLTSVPTFYISDARIVMGTDAIEIAWKF
jgi:hypothetical protein